MKFMTNTNMVIPSSLFPKGGGEGHEGSDVGEGGEGGEGAAEVLVRGLLVLLVRVRVRVQSDM